MPAPITQIAGAVVTELEAISGGGTEGLSQAFIVERVYIPEFDSKSETDLKVFVLGLNQGMQASSRAVFSHTYDIRLAVYKVIEPTVENVDGMLVFVGEFIDLLRGKSLSTAEGKAGVQAIANEPVYDPASLDEHNTFLSVITVTYQLIR